LQVRRRDGRHAGAGRVFARSLLLPIDIVVIGPLLALVTPRHQRLGDMLAGTVVGGSRIGAFASLIGLALAGAIGYAQIEFGGGLTSAIGVVAETTDYAPGVYARVAGMLGIASARLPAIVPNAAPSAEPSAEPSVAPTRATSGTSSV
ncbi:MAG: hypothetical protein IAI50_12605, partial [Candidatus Eremiobacteraeota bacterium]|nr:hypothetical protein [Candidatus Eremiobacteraeota bacterium]